MKPIFVVNFKAYEQGFGEAGLKLAKTVEDVASIKGVRAIICVPYTEISKIAAHVKIPVYAQHCDVVEDGQHTGWVTAHMLVSAGATGTLLNHSEHRIKNLEETAKHAQAAGLKVIVCAQDAVEVQILRNLPVEFVAVEPPELIGGDISVSTARPELITQCTKHSDKLLVGAGIKHRVDVEKSLKHGAKGVLVASGIVKATNQKEALMDLMSGW